MTDPENTRRCARCGVELPRAYSQYTIVCPDCDVIIEAAQKKFTLPFPVWIAIGLVPAICMTLISINPNEEQYVTLGYFLIAALASPFYLLVWSWWYAHAQELTLARLLVNAFLMLVVNGVLTFGGCVAYYGPP